MDEAPREAQRPNLKNNNNNTGNIIFTTSTTTTATRRGDGAAEPGVGAENIPQSGTNTEYAAAQQLSQPLDSDVGVEELEVRLRALGSWAKVPYAFLSHYIQTALSSSAGTGRGSTSRPTSSAKDKTFSSPARTASLIGAASASEVAPGREGSSLPASPSKAQSEAQGAEESVKVSACLERLATVAERQEQLISQVRSPEGLAALDGAARGTAHARAGSPDEEARWNDKVNALAGLEFKA